MNNHTDLPSFIPKILYEDDILVVLDKPAGLLVHPSWISTAQTPTLVKWLKQQFPSDIFHTIHRLDRATSGIMVFVRNDKQAAQQMHQQFLDRRILKTYLCVVRGWTNAEGSIDHLLTQEKDHYADPFASKDKPPQDALTHYRTLSHTELPIPIGRYPVARYSLVEIKPETGRKHQIRRHMKHIFHPIVGDTKYGEGRHNRLFREHFNLQRLLLMATELRFDHPTELKQIKMRTRPDEAVTQLFSQLGWNNLSELSQNPDLRI